ncbi:MAG: hypothetical protein ACREJK_10740 [Candidatus Methylomirabilales bacterium]
MLYYMVEFDPRPGIKRKQITQAYRKFANHFQKTFPEVKFTGFFARDILLGARPQYFALWEVPDYATLDTWKRTFSADKEGRKLSEELNGLGMNWDAKMVSRIDLQ